MDKLYAILLTVIIPCIILPHSFFFSIALVVRQVMKQQLQDGLMTMPLSRKYQLLISPKMAGGSIIEDNLYNSKRILHQMVLFIETYTDLRRITNNLSYF